MSDKTLAKIGALFAKKKEEGQIKNADVANQEKPQSDINEDNKKQTQKSKDLQMSILDDFKGYQEKQDKLTKKIKKNKDKKDDKKKNKNDYKSVQDAPKPKQMKDPVTIRQIAGIIWEDPTLADWPTDDYRLFVGNLGNEVTDTVLSNAFRKYASFQRARVVRDKRSLKTKGYGFVSLKDSADYLQAYKEMNGAYVGNRPCKLQASNWKNRQHEYKKDDDLVGQFKKLNKQKNQFQGYMVPKRP